MRIGVDATCWANARGYGRYARELVTAMTEAAPEDEFVCFLDARAAECFDLAGPNVRTVEVPQSVSPTEAAVSESRRAPSDMLRFTWAVWRESPEVFFSPSVYTYFPLPPGQRAIVAIHDAIAERFPELTLPTPRDRRFWNLKVAFAIRQARLILTVSDYAKKELAEVHRIPESRLRVAVEAPADVFAPEERSGAIAAAAAKVGLPDGSRWFTYVGGFNPHKNVPAIVRAHARLARSSAVPPHLLLVGSLGSEGFHGEVDAIRGAVAEGGSEALVHWTGFVADEELRALHSGSRGLLLLSESEGFGLPAVEAAACGCPVIATTESPLPQLLEGGGYFMEPGDEEGALRAMSALLGDDTHRDALGRVALERARALSWERAAGHTLAALREAAA